MIPGEVPLVCICPGITVPASHWNHHRLVFSTLAESGPSSLFYVTEKLCIHSPIAIDVQHLEVTGVSQFWQCSLEILEIMWPKACHQGHKDEWGIEASDRLREPWLFSLENRNLKGDLINVNKYLNARRGRKMEPGFLKWYPLIE